MSISAEEAHASFKDFKKKEDAEINEGKERVLSKTIKIDVEGFQFEVTGKLTPAQVRLAADIDDDIISYSELASAYAQFMASVSVHPAMQCEDFWIEYDKETAYLPDIVTYVLKHAERVAPVIKQFR